MPRRLTPDPLQVDPWTNPVRISMPALWRYFVVKQRWTRDREFRSIKVVASDDECEGVGLGGGRYLSTYARVSFPFVNEDEEDLRVDLVRKDPIGTGVTPTEEKDKWERAPGTVFAGDPYTQRDFNPNDPANKVTDYEDEGVAIGAGPCFNVDPANGGREVPTWSGVWTENSANPEQDVDPSRAITYLPSLDTFDDEFPQPVTDIDEGGELGFSQHLVGAETNACCGGSNEDANLEPLTRLYTVGDWKAWSLSYDPKSGADNTIIVSPDGKEIPTKLIGWVPRYISFQGDKIGMGWIYERTDIDFNDENNGDT